MSESPQVIDLCTPEKKSVCSDDDDASTSRGRTSSSSSSSGVDAIPSPLADSAVPVTEPSTIGTCSSSSSSSSSLPENSKAFTTTTTTTKVATMTTTTHSPSADPPSRRVRTKAMKSIPPPASKVRTESNDAETKNTTTNTTNDSGGVWDRWKNLLQRNPQGSQNASIVFEDDKVSSPSPPRPNKRRVSESMSDLKPPAKRTKTTSDSIQEEASQQALPGNPSRERLFHSTTTVPTSPVQQRQPSLRLTRGSNDTEQQQQQQQQQPDTPSSSGANKLVSLPSSSSGKRGGKGRSIRCKNCVGCRQVPCLVCCVCKGVSGSSCGFRPCRNLAAATLCNLKTAARRVAREADEGSACAVLFEQLYGESGPFSGAAKKATTTATVPTSPVARQRSMRPTAGSKDTDQQQQQLDTPSSSVAKPSGSGNQGGRSIRCEGCLGCRQERCGICSKCRCATGASCAFRPCHNLSNLTLCSMKSAARTVAREAGSVYAALFEQLYGESGPFSGVGKKATTTATVPTSPVQRQTSLRLTVGSKDTEQQQHVSPSSGANKLVSLPSSSCGKQGRKGRSVRCENCVGCRQEHCGGVCSFCKTGSLSKCAFRPCHNYATTTLYNLKIAAKKVVREAGFKSVYATWFEKLYESGPFCAVAYSSTTAPRKPSALESSIPPAPLSSPIKQGGKRRSTRCKNCLGCRQKPCGGICCFCKAGSRSACAFRPCHNYADTTLYNMKCAARNAVQKTGDSSVLGDLFEKLFGESGPFCAVPYSTAKTPPATGNAHERAFGSATPIISTHFAKQGGKGHSIRCEDCLGCRQERCGGNCSLCKSGSRSACAFRPCQNYGAATLYNMKCAAGKVARETGEGSVYALLFDQLYGESGPFCAVTYSTTTANGNAPSQQLALDSTTPATSLSPTKQGRKRRSTRCENCLGCGQEPCGGICSTCKSGSYGACAFRPCHNYAASSLLVMKGVARTVVRKTGGTEGSMYATLFDRLYGDLEGSFCPETQKGTKTTTRTTSSSGNELPRGTKFKCGTCPSCAGGRCGVCIPCKGLSRDLTACAFQRCEEVTYASSTWARARHYAEQAVAETKRQNGTSRLDKRFEIVFNNGEKQKATQKRAEAVLVGTRVYCLWPENQMWYFGNVFAKKQTTKKGVRFSVHFDDDTRREDVPARDFVTKEDSDPQKWDEIACSLYKDSLCYVQTEKGWRWGQVTEILDKYDPPSYKICLLGGKDRRQRVYQREQILSRQEYYDEHGDLPKPDQYALPPWEMEMLKGTTCDSTLVVRESDQPTVESVTRSCDGCSMCAKKDCGTCKSCRLNEGSTLPKRRTCLVKMCVDVPACEKSQEIGCGFTELDGFTFYVTDPALIPQSLQKEAPAHPSLEGLLICGPSGEVFRTLEDAAALIDVEVDNPLRRESVARFYEQTLGVDMVDSCRDHPLVGKGFYHHWLDQESSPREIFGEITECNKHPIHGTTHFTVKINKHTREFLRVGGLIDGSIDHWHDVTEEDAWGGYFAWLLECGMESTLAAEEHPSLYHRYHVPRSVTKRTSTNGLPVISFNSKGFRVTIRAKRSGIPDAGLGLWISASSLDPEHKQGDLELKAGEMIDLGVYAPLVAEDFKKDHILLLKNFMFNREPEGWTFDSILHNGDGDSSSFAFDITSDTTGELHDKAKKNVVVYANETDGKPDSTATIRAGHDPEGCVHYYVGNEQNSIVIPGDGVLTELKIDYGPKYEKVRVHKGYPRVSGEELKRLDEETKMEEIDDMRELHASSVRDIVESLEFWEPVVETWQSSPPDDVSVLLRTLVATIVFQDRLADICRSFEGVDTSAVDTFCDNGFTTMAQDRPGRRLKELTLTLCSLFASSKQMKKSLLGNPLYKSEVAQALRLSDVADLDSIKSHDLRKRIESL